MTSLWHHHEVIFSLCFMTSYDMTSLYFRPLKKVLQCIYRPLWTVTPILNPSRPTNRPNDIVWPHMTSSSTLWHHMTSCDIIWYHNSLSGAYHSYSGALLHNAPQWHHNAPQWHHDAPQWHHDAPQWHHDAPQWHHSIVKKPRLLALPLCVD